MTEPWRVVVLGGSPDPTGAGLGEQDHLARMYVPALTRHPSFTVVDRTDDVARAVGLEADLVCVAVGLSRRVEVVTTLLEAGRAVLADKPLAADAAGAADLADLAERRGVALIPAMYQRFAPALRTGLPAVAAGRIGLSWHLQVDFVVAGGPVAPIGDLLNLGVHPLDVVVAALPPVRRVRARSAGPAGAGHELTVVQTDHDHGCTATVLTGRLPALSDTAPATLVRHAYRFSGSHGVLHLDATKPSVAVRTGAGVRRPWSGPTAVDGLLDATALRLAGARGSAPTGHEAAAVLRVVEAATASLRTGAPIELGRSR